MNGIFLRCSISDIVADCLHDSFPTYFPTRAFSLWCLTLPLLLIPQLFVLPLSLPFLSLLPLICVSISCWLFFSSSFSSALRPQGGGADVLLLPSRDYEVQQHRHVHTTEAPRLVVFD